MRCLVMVVCCFFASTLRAEVYRCVDEEGVVIFTNIGCPELSEGGEIEVPENITIIDNSNIRKKMIRRERLDADTDLRDYQVKMPADQKQQKDSKPDVIYTMDMNKCRDSLKEMKQATSVDIEKRNPVLIDSLKYIANMYCGKHHQESKDFEVLYSDECGTALKRLHNISEKTNDDLVLTTEKLAADTVCLP